MTPTDRNSFAAVIVAGGAGTRFGGDLPKQFLSLAGRKVLDHSVGVFSELVDTIIVVLPAGTVERGIWNAPDGVTVVKGGRRRQDSVLNGVSAAAESGAAFVLVHDGARPAVTVDLVKRVMKGVLESGCCIPCIPVSDTVKRVDGSAVAATVDRSVLRLAQTPQGFRTEELIKVLENASDITDEASAMESAGFTVYTVEGDRMNLKVTTGEDLEMLKKHMGSGMTVSAAGLDFHRFGIEKPLVVCGCRLADSGGLLGHSDGDVVLHAVADAVLAAARAGDIGTHFPPGESQWKNADSAMLLQQSMEIVRKKGFEVANLDVTLIGEKPKVAPLRDRFIKRLSEILMIEPEKLWIKGTTTNSLGDLGRGEGLGCLAIVTMRALC